MRRNIVYIMAIALVLWCNATTYSQEIAVNSGNPIESISVGELRDIYFGRKVFWKGAENPVRIHPVFNQGKDARNSFFRLIKASEIEYKKNWIRLTLSGRSDPPAGAGSDEEVLRFVRENRYGVGFVVSFKETGGVKTIKVAE